MSRHSRRRNAALSRGPKGLAQSKIINPDSIGTVLTREDQDVALPTHAVLDLEALTKEKGGTPSFKTRKADPMRPFAVPGGKISIPIAASVQRRINEVRKNGETDAHVLERIMEPERNSYPPGSTEAELWAEVEGMMPARDAPILGPLPFPPGDPANITAQKVADVLSELKPDARARVVSALEKSSLFDTLKGRKAAAESDLWNAEKDLKNIEEKKSALQLRLQAAEDIAAMASAPKLQKLGESAVHKLVAAYRDGTIIFPDERATPKRDELIDIWQTISENPNIFVVQHDWAAAFQNATDFSDGEFCLPYSEVIFEFRISGRRTCMSLVTDDDSHIKGCILNIESSVGWVMAACYEVCGGVWTEFKDADDLSAPILNLCRAQIRAICIALEAEVAVTEVIRAPHRLNMKRERAGKLPIYAHHIVSLANRKRYAPRTIEEGELEDEHRKRRLHFVRGHWVRHTNHRSWRKWHLRGSPDLGFVDKEYRL